MKKSKKARRLTEASIKASELNHAQKHFCLRFCIECCKEHDQVNYICCKEHDQVDFICCKEHDQVNHICCKDHDQINHLYCKNHDQVNHPRCKEQNQAIASTARNMIRWANDAARTMNR